MRSNRQPLVQLCGKLLRERKVCTSDILAFASSHDQPRSGPNNSERESTSGRSTNYGSGRLIQVFRDIGRIFSLLFLLSHPRRPLVTRQEGGFKSANAIWFRRGQKMVSIVFRVELTDGGRARRPKTRTPPSVWEGRGLGNPHLVRRTKECYEGSASPTHGARQRFLTEGPAQTITAGRSLWA